MTTEESQGGASLRPNPTWIPGQARNDKIIKVSCQTVILEGAQQFTLSEAEGKNLRVGIKRLSSPLAGEDTGEG
jgi:hypothetical protein